MPDYVHTTTLDLYRSQWPQPAGTVELTRAEYNAASAIPHKYRKWTGSAVAEMTQAEKDAVDAALEAARIAALRTDADANLSVNRDDRSLIIRALAKTILDEINILRAEHALAPRTFAQMVTAVKNKIAAGEGEA